MECGGMKPESDHDKEEEAGKDLKDASSSGRTISLFYAGCVPVSGEDS